MYSHLSNSQFNPALKLRAARYCPKRILGFFLDYQQRMQKLHNRNNAQSIFEYLLGNPFSQM